MHELRFFILLLHNCPGIRDKVLYRIFKAIYFEGITPTRFLEFTYNIYRNKFKLSHEASFSLSQTLPDLLEKTSKFMEVLDRLGFIVISIFDREYPGAMKEFFELPPPVLYVRGDLSLLERSTFTILNSRDVGERCVEIPLRIIEGETDILVSGIYGPGYAYALHYNGLKIGISDRGVMQISGKRLEKFDTVVAFSGMDDMGTPSSMRLRDRVVVSLSDRVMGGCIRPGGNMYHLIQEARNKGKEVCVFDFDIEGNRELIELGLNPCKIVHFA